ncbi:MAG: adenylyltransferase/cytidyltransferase family protein [Deferribacteraceae bacterium]|jgi:[citrate (pro-3S)-lyase] ligase|nr:adenylyltransferase/cytidyltransferase family protein [Deferribacteraceae bacterium]
MQPFVYCDFFDAETNMAFNEYLKGLHDIKTISHSYRVCGAVVMNCNPFTNGHRYLIEQASQRVDFLYLFILEEDKSFFPFKERYALVCNGVHDLKNVKVLPGGKFIISSLTFPGYFTKEEVHNKKDSSSDISVDLNLFGSHIAPALGISVRFAGSEPFCTVTKQYNEAMRNLLPVYGIKFVEIERVRHDGGFISATNVRELIKSRDRNKIKELVPEVTYKYISENFF